MQALLTAPAHPQPPTPLRRLAAAIARCRVAAARRRTLQALDASALRDLGLDRSEIDSVVAEGLGAAPLTRRRLGAAR